MTSHEIRIRTLVALALLALIGIFDCQEISKPEPRINSEFLIGNWAGRFGADTTYEVTITIIDTLITYYAGDTLTVDSIRYIITKDISADHTKQFMITSRRVSPPQTIICLRSITYKWELQDDVIIVSDTVSPNAIPIPVSFVSTDSINLDLSAFSEYRRGCIYPTTYGITGFRRTSTPVFVLTCDQLVEVDNNLYRCEYE